MDIENIDILFKIIIVGDPEVGKTQLMNRLLFDRFELNVRPTLGIDFLKKDLDISNKRIRLNMWDTAGQERYQAINQNFYSNAHGAVIVFDFTQKDSLQNVRQWLTNIQEYAMENSQFILIGDSRL